MRPEGWVSRPANPRYTMRQCSRQNINEIRDLNALEISDHACFNQKLCLHSGHLNAQSTVATVASAWIKNLSSLLVVEEIIMRKLLSVGLAIWLSLLAFVPTVCAQEPVDREMN